MARTKQGIDAFAGNMPFLGGRRIATQNGDRYAEWLSERYAGTGDTDYVGYFFHRARELMAPRGSLGLIATNSIADGDNRRSILGRLVADSFRIHRADTGVPWPGNAQVLIATLFLERGLPEGAASPPLLDGRPVAAINSRLRSGEEWPEPEPLPENTGLALTGCFLRSAGFILQGEEAEALLQSHPEEEEVIRPFLTGDDLNGAPDHQPERYVVDFRDLTLEQARRYPEALALVQERVRPGRERLKTKGADAEHRKYWWRFANVRLELRRRAAELPRLLATARVSKHSTFAFVSPEWTPSEQVVVFPLPSWTAFAVLQSRLHGIWVSLQATHLGQGLRYSAGDCLLPFPFPSRDPREQHSELEAIGQHLYEARAALLRERQLGMTQLYNQLKAPCEEDSDLASLRNLHIQLDRAVLAAYGWQQVSVPGLNQPDPYYEDAVAGRLFALNAQRGAEAAAVGRGKKQGPKAKGAEPGMKKARHSKGPGARKAAQHPSNDTVRKRGAR